MSAFGHKEDIRTLVAAIDQNSAIRATVCPFQCFALFNRDPNEFFRRFVPVNEVLIHHITLEIEEQLKK